MTFRKANYVHFLSADCEITSLERKLLLDLGAFYLEDFRARKPKKGQIVISNKQKYKIFHVCITDNYFENVNPDDFNVCIKELSRAMKSSGTHDVRISRIDDEIQRLSRQVLVDLLNQAFEDFPVEITLCYGSSVTPPESLRKEILQEAHNSLMGGHKGVIKTYRQIRE